MDNGNEEDNFMFKKNALAMRLQQRRSRKVLAEQGIMPPLKTPGSYFPQVQRLERARKEDYLNHAIQVRPERDLLVQKHILEDTSASGSIVASQKDLKKAKLVDDLNDKIAFRPGVIELLERNILPANEEVQEALKGGQIPYKKTADCFEDDSGDAMSPEQSVSIGCTSSVVYHHPAPISTTLPHSDQIVSLATKNELARTTSGSSLMQLSGSGSHPYLIRQSSKGSNIRMSSARKKKDKPRFKKFKYHQYVPPDQQGKSSDRSLPSLTEDTRYSRLLHQQQMYLQLQIINTQYSNQLGTQRGGESSQSGSFNQQPLGAPSPPPPPTQVIKLEKPYNNVGTSLLESKLDEMKVSELKEELKMRGQKVTGTKEVLVERLKKSFSVKSRSDKMFLPNMSTSSDDVKTNFSAPGSASLLSEMNLSNDGHSLSPAVTSSMSMSMEHAKQHSNTSNAQTAFPIDPNAGFSHKRARMPIPERHKIVFEQEKFTMPTWHSTDHNQNSSSSSHSTSGFNPTNRDLNKDKMLEKQQKQINDLKRMVELHRSQLQQLHNQKQHEVVKERLSESLETARLSTTQFQFPVLLHTDNPSAQFNPSSSSCAQQRQPQRQRYQSMNLPNYEQAYELMNGNEATDTPAGSKDMDDLLEFLTDTGELPASPVVTRQLLNDHHSYHGISERRGDQRCSNYQQHGGINNYVITQEQVQLEREVRLSQMNKSSREYSNNGNADYSGQNGPHDLTKMLVESGGDALMDTSSFPPLVNQYTSTNNPNVDLQAIDYSRQSGRNSFDSGLIYASHFSPMDTNVDQNRDLISDLRLSTSSLDSGEPTLNAVSLSPATPPRIKHPYHIQPLSNQYHVSSPRQVNHNLVKSASQELLSSNESAPPPNNPMNSELGWLDLTLGSAVGQPPSPGGPFEAITLEEQSLHHAQHPNMYRGSQDADLNLYMGNNPTYMTNTNNNSILDPQWEPWDGLLGNGFNNS